MLALPLAACGGGEPTLGPGDWPQFRGPGGQGIAAPLPLPAVWSPGSDNIRWSVEVPGFGRASPIVVGGRVYLAIAEENGDNLDHGVAAIDAESGALVWKTTVSSRQQLTLKNRLGVHSGATPASDGQAIYAYFGAELAALDLDGNLLWSQVVEDDYEETTRYGAGSSPVVVGDLVVILQDKEYASDDYDVGWLAAFDRSTGELRWRTEFEDGCCSYVTPVIRETDAGAEILVALTQEVAAYSAETGERLWGDAQDMNQPVASPVLEGDLFCVASGAHNVRETVCRRLSGAGADTRVEVLWRTSRAVAETASPVLYDGRLYVMTQRGVVTCYDSLTGRILWRERLQAGNYHASLLAGDGKIYAFNNSGVTSVMASGDQGRVLSINDLGESASIATPAFADGRLYMRLRGNLISIEKESESGA